MSNYTIALFLHVVGALGLFIALGLEWTSLRLLQRASTVEQAREQLRVAAGVRVMGGLSVGILIISGFYMTATVWGGVAWISVALGSLILLAIIGAALSGPRMAAITRSLAEETGPVNATLRRRLRNPLLWASIQTRAGLALGIVFLMTVKPGLNGSLLVIGVAAILGLASALVMVGRRRTYQPDEASAHR